MEGEWKNDHFHLGIAIFPDGDQHSGLFENYKLIKGEKKTKTGQIIPVG